MIEEISEQIFADCRGVAEGAFVWAPVPHLEEVPRILNVERAASEDHFATRFDISQINNSHFKRKTKLPIKALGLGETEELLISKSKKRPCIVLTQEKTQFSDSDLQEQIGKRKHLQDNSFILAPLYGIETEDDKSGFPPIMVSRIRSLMYSQFFYVPSKCPKTRHAFKSPGVLRLDRLFPSLPSRGVDPMNFKLSEEVFELLRAILRERFGGEPTEALLTIRELLLETLPDEAKPPTT